MCICERDCAGDGPICPNRKLPCDPKDPVTIDMLKAKMWEMFEFGKNNYRGCAKEVIEETLSQIQSGGLTHNVGLKA